MSQQQPESETAYAKVLERIAVCRQSGGKQLNLSSLGLSTLPPEIGQLTALTTVYLMNNRLTALPGCLRDLHKLEWLGLQDNPALQLSPAVLGSDPRNSSEDCASAQSILDFYFGRETGQARPLNEVKLILIGRGEPGRRVRCTPCATSRSGRAKRARRGSRCATG